MKSIVITVTFIGLFYFTANAQWNVAGDSYSSGGIGLGTTSLGDYDISINKDNPLHSGIRIINTATAGRVLVLLGEAYSGNKYGYLAHHGSTHSGSLAFKKSSTTLAGFDLNGLNLVSGNDMRFFSGGSADANLRMVINAAGNTEVLGQMYAGQHIRFKNHPNNKDFITGQYEPIIYSSTAGGTIPGGSSSLVLQAGGTGSGRHMFFRTFDATRMMIAENGNIGIGTTDPQRTFHLNGRARIERTSEAGIEFKATTSTQFWDIGTNNLGFYISEVNSATYKFVVNQNGNVGIGTTNPGSYKLAVEGKVGAREVVVSLDNPWPDYVFDSTYVLPALSEVEAYIKTNKHLPEIPSETEVKENGVAVGEMNALLLKKIEELTLYVIDLEKAKIELEAANIKLQNENISFRKEVSRLDKFEEEIAALKELLKK